MAWTANIISTQRQGNAFKVSVGYDNGAGTLTSEDYQFQAPDLAVLKSQIQARLNVLNAQDTFVLPPGPIDVTASTPTQAQLDQQQFISDYNLWQQVKRGIDVGILTGTEPAVVTLLNKVKAEFKPAYLNLL